LAALKPVSNRFEFAVPNANDEMKLVAFAHTIRLVETEADFLVRRAIKARPSDMLPFLDAVKKEFPPVAEELWQIVATRPPQIPP
jgi:uncharacterized protein YfaT (DUF1175 family)